MIKKIISYDKSTLYLNDLKLIKKGKSDFKKIEDLKEYYKYDFFLDADQIFFKYKDKYYDIIVVIDKENGEIIHRYSQDFIEDKNIINVELLEKIEAFKNIQDYIIKAVNIFLFNKEYSDIISFPDIYCDNCKTFPFKFEELIFNEGKYTYKDFDIIVFYRWWTWYTYNYNAFKIKNKK